MKNEWRRFATCILFLSVLNGLMTVPACRHDNGPDPYRPHAAR